MAELADAVDSKSTSREGVGVRPPLWAPYLFSLKMKTGDDALSALKTALGTDVATDENSLFDASYDAMKLSFLPQAVIRPSSPDSISTVLRFANQYNIPVTTRGAGSSLTGSATPVKGGWVLDLTQLNSIKIDDLSKFAYVGAGAITGDIQQCAEAKGLFYPPDPSSSSFCTIGGNIACNAGGLRGVKYGVTRDYIVSLKGFLPTGEAVSWGLPLKKFASGYNLRDLWIGSEGTLGVITEAVLKLIPKPQVTRTFLVDFLDEKSALKAAQAFLKTGVVPSIMEFLDRLSVLGAEQITGMLFESAPCHSILLIELDGHPAVVEEEEAILIKWAKEYSNKFLQASTPDEAKSLWRIRRECSAAMFQHGNSKLNEDIVVPLDKTVELIEFVQELSREKSLKIPTFGHVGDGNFHVNLMYNRQDKVQCRQAQEALFSLMEHVVRLGGAITGEHGIGLAKSPFLKLQHTDIEINTMLAIKKTLDPNGILNPGKIFTRFQAWDHAPVAVKMPWEDKKTL